MAINFRAQCARQCYTLQLASVLRRACGTLSLLWLACWNIRVILQPSAALTFQSDVEITRESSICEFPSYLYTCIINIRGAWCNICERCFLATAGVACVFGYTWCAIIKTDMTSLYVRDMALVPDWICVACGNWRYWEVSSSSFSYIIINV